MIEPNRGKALIGRRTASGSGRVVLQSSQVGWSARNWARTQGEMDQLKARWQTSAAAAKSRGERDTREDENAQVEKAARRHGPVPTAHRSSRKTRPERF